MATFAFGQDGYWSHQSSSDDDDDDRSRSRNRQRIQMALILDTSGSMDDLIDQARGQMWSMVQDIIYSVEAEYGAAPDLEIALYEYGSSRLNRGQDYIALHTPLTRDLDWVADELFTLRTGGSVEYHGAAVSRAVNELRWSRDPRDLKIIFIAGNESFRQGPVDPRRAMAEAQSQDIIVNTIFCGDWNDGRRLGWEEGAYLSGGEYLAIDGYYRDNQYDPRFQSQLLGLNTAYNATYLPYGAYGRDRYDRLCRIDNYAVNYGQTVIINRTLVKVSTIYVYPEWDLVDAYRLGLIDIRTMADADFPPSMRGMSFAQRQAYLIRMQQDRDRIRREITQVTAPRRPMAPPRNAPTANSQAPRQASPGSSPRAAQQPNNLDRAVSQTVIQQQARRANPGSAVPAPSRQPATQQSIAPRESSRPATRPTTTTPQRPTQVEAPARTTNPGNSSYQRPAATPSRESAPAPAARPAAESRPASQPAARQTSQPAPAARPAAESRPATQPAARPTTQPAPAARQAAETRPATQQPATGRTTSPAAESSTEGRQPATTTSPAPRTPASRRP